MERSLPLGPLANAVIEQFGDLAHLAVGSVVERHEGPSAGVGKRRVRGHVFTDRELAEQSLRPGNWVTIGAVRDGASTTLVEINLGTWESREIGQAS